jgi:hypothetical protein
MPIINLAWRRQKAAASVLTLQRKVLEALSTSPQSVDQIAIPSPKNNSRQFTCCRAFAANGRVGSAQGSPESKLFEVGAQLGLAHGPSLRSNKMVLA